MSDSMPPDDEQTPQPSENVPPGLSDGMPPPPGAEAPEPPALEPPPEPRRRGAKIAAVVVAAVLVVGAAAGAFAYFTLRGASESVLDKVPVSADLVVVAHLDPAASQKENLFRMTAEFPDLGTQEELTQRLNDLLDEGLRDAGLTHDDLGWIGGEIGAYADIGAGAPSFAAILSVDDESAADDAITRLRESATASGTTYSSTTISGVEVWVPSSSDQPAAAVFHGVAVLASDENAIRAVIDTANGASSVQDDAAFQGVMDRLPEDNLGFAYVNVEQLVSLLDSIPSGLLPTTPSLSQLNGTQGVGFSISAEPAGLAIDSVVTTDPSKLTEAQRDALAAGDEPNPLLALVPADAYAVVAANGGANQGTVRGSLNQLGQIDPSTARLIRRLRLTGPDGVLSHLTGDAALQVGPAKGLIPVGGTVVIGVDDADAVSAWLDRYLPVLLHEADLVPGGNLPLASEDYNGVRITSVRSPIPTPIAWGVLDSALVVGLSPEAVEQAVDLSQAGTGGITTDPGYTSAVESMPGTQSVLYVDVQSIMSAVQGFMGAEQYQTFLDEGGRDVEPIEAVVAGSASDENGTTSRLLIRIP